MKNIYFFLVPLVVIFTFTGFKNEDNQEKRINEKGQSYKPIVMADALALPLPSCGIFYLDDVDLLGQFVPHYQTPIFNNNYDNHYYSDSSFTAFVPDGYYSDPNTMYYIPDGYGLYFHIVDGWIIGHIYVLMEGEGPGVPSCS